MESKQIREKFLEFFRSKGHQIVPSAPMVIKDDPTLMFTNAGMNQFKDIFLGNTIPKHKRVANSQKCLRVSGKHNDLEEVGVDTYHHTMFEMLGNWSFGDYFKAEAIAWSWELLTEVFKLDPDRLYVTVFEGDEQEGLPPSEIALSEWSKIVSKDHIVFGSKKDNFWEMGDTGPCGPCSEIHVDLRTQEERAALPGNLLVNKDHPQVIEIWNNVFIQFNRRKDGSLENLPEKHVDTGMGFERLVRVIQGKSSNYDTDVFRPLISHIELITGLVYGKDEKIDIAMRVLSDHIRTISFAITDGQLPSNNKAGYVIRRILRRAVRYAYTFLNRREPFLAGMVPVLQQIMGDHYPELIAQGELIRKVIQEEESAFLRTLETGIHRFNDFMEKNPDVSVIPGEFVFELFDTYGFPKDLTSLMAREQGKLIEEVAFEAALQKQKERSRSAAATDAGDWVYLLDQSEHNTEFVGYEEEEASVLITAYREIETKGKKQVQLIFDVSPFYAESGGQVGDTGYLIHDTEKIQILDTRREHGQILHLADRLPSNLLKTWTAMIDKDRRDDIRRNHSATHLLHAALREILGKHVEQKGSLVNEHHLRFDFSHYEKPSAGQLEQIENRVNAQILRNIAAETALMPLEQAKKTGAMALFGEKYADLVRVVTFDPNYSIELCGGTHVRASGQIGIFRIISEGAIAAGVRRIEAVTGIVAAGHAAHDRKQLALIKELLKNPADTTKAIRNLLDTTAALEKRLDQVNREQTKAIESQLEQSIQVIGNKRLINSVINIDSSEHIKDLAFRLKDRYADLCLVLGHQSNNKPMITVALGKLLVDSGLSASVLVRELSKDIKGGGGGQAFFATAGGNDLSGLEHAIKRSASLLDS
jgi:alanyl-tRNA synthetase